MAVARVDVTVAPAGAPRYGLLKVATGPADLPAHAGFGGLQYDVPECGAAPSSYPLPCDVQDRPTKDFGAGLGVAEADPFVMYAGATCQLPGRSVEFFQQVAADRLTAGEQYGLESKLWADLIGDADLLDLGGIPGGVIAGVSALEQWLYGDQAYPYPGIIHAVPAAAGYAGRDNLAVASGQGGVLRTPLGTAWSFGGGYGSDGPGATEAPAGAVWLVITGAVRVWRDPDIFQVPVPAGLDRTTNDVYAVAERAYAMSHDCGAAAVLVNLDPSGPDVTEPPVAEQLTVTVAPASVTLTTS